MHTHYPAQSGDRLLSCSADKTVRCWDVEVGAQVKKLTEHTNFVNSCCTLRRGPSLFVSGSDDASIKVGRGDRGGGAG